MEIDPCYKEGLDLLLIFCALEGDENTLRMQIQHHSMWYLHQLPGRSVQNLGNGLPTFENSCLIKQTGCSNHRGKKAAPLRILVVSLTKTSINLNVGGTAGHELQSEVGYGSKSLARINESLRIN